MTTVQDYLVQLQKGRTIRPINDVSMMLELAPPDPRDPDKGFDEGVTADETYKAWMAFSAWLRLYDAYHKESFQRMIARRGSTPEVDRTPEARPRPGPGPL